MSGYSFQPRDRIFVKDYGFLSSASNIGRNIGRNISKNVSRNTVRQLLIMLNNLLQMHLKLLQKEQFKKSRSKW